MQHDREQLIRRFIAISHELAEMAAHKLLRDLVGDWGGELLEELGRGCLASEQT